MSENDGGEVETPTGEPAQEGELIELERREREKREREEAAEKRSDAPAAEVPEVPLEETGELDATEIPDDPES